jgi:predicted  nucleic acid-binding Zn-ribbon protein
VARIAYWSGGGAPVRITIRDENGSAWQELAGPQARGLNVVEYDLAADPAKADAAEAVAREKARAREAREKPDHPAAAAAASDDEEGDEGEDEGEKTDEKALVTAPAKPLTDPELARVLADPLRATRRRYLPPGKYTVEIASGGLVEKTSFTVKLPKKDRDDEE